MKWVRNVLPPVVVGVAAILAWQLTVDLGRIAPFILPSPSAIWAELVEQKQNVWEAALASGTNALIGLVAGAILGVLFAMAASRFRPLAEVSIPFAAVISALPIIALAPILNNMFEATSSIPRRIVAAIIVFFPVFLNTLRGLREVNPIHQELMHTYAASGWTFARKVRLPGALPYVFTGLRQASSLAVIAAVVAEYFGGLQDGLGSRITSAASFTAYPRAWAFVVGACLLGLAFYLTTLLLERLAMPWRTRLIS
ncbi:ABC transporter permease [Actinoplanes sp. NPDC026619]|uniref:ABC transporter permease n=1 Tax=Actinoplanes sp. NPDC026619 TaxID=3155798 RepID=UPI0033F93312